MIQQYAIPIFIFILVVVVFSMLLSFQSKNKQLADFEQMTNKPMFLCGKGVKEDIDIVLQKLKNVQKQVNQPIPQDKTIIDKINELDKQITDILQLSEIQHGHVICVICQTHITIGVPVCLMKDHSMCYNCFIQYVLNKTSDQLKQNGNSTKFEIKCPMCGVVGNLQQITEILDFYKARKSGFYYIDEMYNKYGIPHIDRPKQAFTKIYSDLDLNTYITAIKSIKQMKGDQYIDYNTRQAYLAKLPTNLQQIDIVEPDNEPANQPRSEPRSEPIIRDILPLQQLEQRQPIQPIRQPIQRQPINNQEAYEPAIPQEFYSQHVHDDWETAKEGIIQGMSSFSITNNGKYTWRNGPILNPLPTSEPYRRDQIMNESRRIAAIRKLIEYVEKGFKCMDKGRQLLISTRKFTFSIVYKLSDYSLLSYDLHVMNRQLDDLNLNRNKEIIMPNEAAQSRLNKIVDY